MTQHQTPAVATEHVSVELRLPVDASEVPLVFVDTPYPDPPEHLAIELAGPGLLATLVLAIGDARAWAGGLLEAVCVAHREATGDPHTLGDAELAGLAAADPYQPGPGLLVRADDGHPARVRFHVVVDIDGHCLSTADLRGWIVRQLAEHFTLSHIAISAGEPIEGQTR